MSPLVLDYVPSDGTPQAAALALHFEPSRCVEGLGVRGGHVVDPRPFISSFPSESERVWLFAEWVETLRSLLASGAGPLQVELYLTTCTGAPLQVSDRINALPARRSNGLRLSSAEHAVEAVAYVLEDALGKPAQRLEPSLSTRRSSPDFVVPTETGTYLVEVKWSAAKLARASVTLVKHDSFCAERTFRLEEPALAEHLREWLVHHASLPA